MLYIYICMHIRFVPGTQSAMAPPCMPPRGTFQGVTVKQEPGAGSKGGCSQSPPPPPPAPPVQTPPRVVPPPSPKPAPGTEASGQVEALLKQIQDSEVNEEVKAEITSSLRKAKQVLSTKRLQGDDLGGSADKKARTRMQIPKTIPLPPGRLPPNGFPQKARPAACAQMTPNRCDTTSTPSTGKGKGTSSLPPPPPPPPLGSLHGSSPKMPLPAPPALAAPPAQSPSPTRPEPTHLMQTFLSSLGVDPSQMADNPHLQAVMQAMQGTSASMTPSKVSKSQHPPPPPPAPEPAHRTPEKKTEPIPTAAKSPPPAAPTTAAEMQSQGPAKPNQQGNDKPPARAEWPGNEWKS